MATRFLLPCPCGDSIAVSSSQAGGRVVCACGDSVEVPALRRLRELAPAPDEATPAGSWGLRQGILTSGVLITLLLAGLGGWFALQEPAPPAPFDAEARRQTVEHRLDTLPPVELWKLWADFYLPQGNQGFNQVQSPRDAWTLAQIDFCRTNRNRLLMAAAGMLVATLGAYVFIPRTAPTP